MRSKTPEALRRTPKPDALRIPVTGKIDGFVAVCTDGSQKFFTKSEMAQFPPRTTEALAPGLENFKGPMGDVSERYRRTILEEMTTRFDDQDEYKVPELRELRKRRNVLAATSLPEATQYTSPVTIEVVSGELTPGFLDKLPEEIKVTTLPEVLSSTPAAEKVVSKPAKHKARKGLMTTAVATFS